MFSRVPTRVKKNNRSCSDEIICGWLSEQQNIILELRYTGKNLVAQIEKMILCVFRWVLDTRDSEQTWFWHFVKLIWLL
jgi:hypothetical protein